MKTSACSFLYYYYYGYLIFLRSLSPHSPLIKTLQVTQIKEIQCLILYLTFNLLSSLFSSQRVLLLAVLPPRFASGRWRWRRGGAAHDRVPPKLLGPVQRLPAARLHVHLAPPADPGQRPRGAGRGELPADGPRGRHLPGFHAAALVRRREGVICCRIRSRRL